MKTRSECPKLEQPNYPDLTPEQNEEYHEFSSALVIWQRQNPGVSVSFGWSAVGCFLLVIAFGAKTTVLHPGRDTQQEALWEMLDEAAKVLKKGATTKSEKLFSVATQVPVEPETANDDWDW